MTPTDVRVRRPSFSVVRLRECGMCFERTLLPHQHAIAATLCVCKLYLYTLRGFHKRLAMGLLAAARAAARRRRIC